MTLTVRLEPEDARLLAQAAELTRRGRSELAREAISRFAQETLRSFTGSAHERLGRWIGSVDSGGKRLSERTGEKVRRILRERRK